MRIVFSMRTFDPHANLFNVSEHANIFSQCELFHHPMVDLDPSIVDINPSMVDPDPSMVYLDSSMVNLDSFHDRLILPWLKLPRYGGQHSSVIRPFLGKENLYRANFSITLDNILRSSDHFGVKKNSIGQRYS
jgi:hypothetical protein